MKYDDASWHYGGNFPADLPAEAGATHSGMFVAWALLSGLAGDIHINDFPEGLKQLRARSITPGAFLLKFCDGKFTQEDLNDLGNAFVPAYFDLQNGRYLADYEGALAGVLPTPYHVPDTWTSFDILEPILDRRFAEWKSTLG